MIRFRSIVCTFALIGSAIAGAQAPFGMSMKYNPMLLMDPVVQNDLKLSPSVVQKINGELMGGFGKLLGSVMGAMQSTSGAGKPDMANAVKSGADAARDTHTDAMQYLTPSQKARLHQITLQSWGALALSDPDNATALGLSKAQQAHLKARLGSSMKADGEKMKGSLQTSNMKDPSSLVTNIIKVMDVMKTDSDAAAHEVLTPAQKAKWSRMQGKQVHLEGFMDMGSILKKILSSYGGGGGVK